MVIEEKLEASSFLAIVVVNIIAMILAIPSLISVLKPILPGVKSKTIALYMYWKIVEVIICPFLDVYALMQSGSFYENKRDEKSATVHSEDQTEEDTAESSDGTSGADDRETRQAEQVKDNRIHGEVDKELYNEEIYTDEELPLVNEISFQAVVITVLVIWIPIRIFIVYILYSY